MVSSEGPRLLASWGSYLTLYSSTIMLCPGLALPGPPLLLPWGKEVYWWEQPTSVLFLSASWLPNIIQLIVIIWDRRLPPAAPEFIWLITTESEPASAALKSRVCGRNRLAACTFSEKPITCLLLLSRNETHIPRGQSPSPAHTRLSQPCGPFCQPLLSETYSWALNHLPMGLEGRQEHKCPSWS